MDSKEKWRIALLGLLILCAFVWVLKITTKEDIITSGPPFVSGLKCVALGGTIINTRSGNGCAESHFLGSLTDNDCPCVCCSG